MKAGEEFAKRGEKDAEASKKMKALMQRWEEMAGVFDEFGRKFDR
jgi:hypothetical protein